MELLSAALFLAAFAEATGGAASAAVTYRVVETQEPAVRVRLPYTLGTHELSARRINGELRLGRGERAAFSGRLTVPIASLHAGNGTLECHMREALGLRYETSRFPGEHVCQDGKLPQTGNDAVVYPEISFEATALKWIEGNLEGSSGRPAKVEVSGRWTIHGVAHDDKLMLAVVRSAAQGGADARLRVTGTTIVHLPSYGVRVKSAFIIRAGEDATVTLDLSLAEAR